MGKGFHFEARQRRWVYPETDIEARTENGTRASRRCWAAVILTAVSHLPAGRQQPGTAGTAVFHYMNPRSHLRRFTFDDDHYFVDLVFYNRLLRCYVLIDLKLDKLTHQDLGLMQMVVNYFDREVKLPDETPTIGLLLCKSAKKTISELTLPKDANIHAHESKHRRDRRP